MLTLTWHWWIIELIRLFPLIFNLFLKEYKSWNFYYLCSLTWWAAAYTFQSSSWAPRWRPFFAPIKWLQCGPWAFSDFNDYFSPKSLEYTSCTGLPCCRARTAAEISYKLCHLQSSLASLFHSVGLPSFNAVSSLIMGPDYFYLATSPGACQGEQD